MCVNKPCEYVVGLEGIVDYTRAMSHFWTEINYFKFDKQENLYL
jgi:hypothetical protein